MHTPTPKMIAKKDGAIGWMIFNQPEKRNAVSADMWAAVPNIIKGFDDDPDIRTIVLAGAGDKAFVAGADISEFGEKRQSKDAVAEYDRIGGLAQHAIATATKPTIAMIKGYCIGGGVAIALSCDIRIVADDAVMGVPAARLGLGYRVSGIQKLMEVVGPSFAKEIFFTAKFFNAEDARFMGLANRIVARADLETYVRDYVGQIASNAPLTVASVKQAVNELLRDPDQRDLASCDAAVEACFESADYIEGRTAFMEKRKPMFLGR